MKDLLNPYILKNKMFQKIKKKMINMKKLNSHYSLLKMQNQKKEKKKKNHSLNKLKNHFMLKKIKLMMLKMKFQVIMI